MDSCQPLVILSNAHSGAEALEGLLQACPRPLTVRWQLLELQRGASRGLQVPPHAAILHVQSPYTSLPTGSDMASAFRNDSAIRKLRSEYPRFFTLQLDRLPAQLRDLAAFLPLDLSFEEIDTFLENVVLPTPPKALLDQDSVRLYEDRRLLLNNDDVLSAEARAALNLREPMQPARYRFEEDLPQELGAIVIAVDCGINESKLKAFLAPARPGCPPNVMVMVFSHFGIIHHFLADPYYATALRNGRLKLWHSSEWEARFEQETGNVRNAVPFCNWVLAEDQHPLRDQIYQALKAHIQKFRNFVDLSRQAATAYYQSDDFVKRQREIVEGARPRVQVEQACTSVAIKQFSRNLAAALKQLGYEVHIHPNCAADQRDVMYATTIDLQRFRPDLLIACPNNFAKHLFLPGDIACPTLLSVQDLEPHLQLPQYLKQYPLSAQDMVLLMQERFREEVSAAGVRDTQILTSVLPTEAPVQDWSQCTVEEKWDVGLVKTMSSHARLLDMVRQQHSPLPEELKSIELAEKIMLERFGNDMPLSIEECRQLAGPHRWSAALLQFAHETMCLRYMRHLQQEGFQLGLSGANWEKFPELRRFALKHIEERRLYQRRFLETKINISLNPWNEYHPRILDGGRCGAFFLVYEVPEEVRWQRLPGELRAGEHYASFRSPEELAEKCHYYLAHPEERKLMGERLRQVVEESFSYESVAEAFIERFREVLRETLPRRAVT